MADGHNGDGSGIFGGAPAPPIATAPPAAFGSALVARRLVERRGAYDRELAR